MQWIMILERKNRWKFFWVINVSANLFLGSISGLLMIKKSNLSSISNFFEKDHLSILQSFDYPDDAVKDHHATHHAV